MSPSKPRKSTPTSRTDNLVRRGAQELAALFKDPDKPPVFLLGAGASYRAGVPMAAEAVWWIVERYYSRNVRADQLAAPRRSELEMWLRKEHSDWLDFTPEKLADNFPEAVDRLLFPAEFRRAVLHDLVQPRNDINDGYKHLARLMQRGLCRTVLTTNFDRLVHAALKAMEPHVRHVIEVNQVPGDFDQFSLMRKFHDHFGKGFEVAAPEPAPDELAVPDATVDELDLDLALATLSRWASRLKRGVVTSDNFESLMLELRLAVKSDEKIVPTLGGLLLFGRKPQNRFPHAYVRVLVGHTQRVVDGNLIEQFRGLREILGASDINPVLRIKSQENSEERSAYPQRVLTETIVNMLVHRDYRIEDFAEIAITPGQSIRFSNPGGLPKDVFARVAPDGYGHFVPVRDATQIRNPCLADIFFGEGSMDREGSGLADVLVMSRENGGDAVFSVATGNTRFVAELKQPFQASPGSSMLARPISASGRYITNHLPFQILPEAIYIIPVRDNPARGDQLPPGLFGERPKLEQSEGQEPVYAGGYKVGRLYSFANFNEFPRFAERRGFLKQMEQHSRSELESTPEGARIISWLLRRHFDHHLQSFASVGLCLDRKRAYFLGAGNEERVIIYDSPKKRNVRRAMVKRRELGKRIFHENEGIWYSIERCAGVWCVRLKPTYVFTEEDGITPLPPFRVSRLATRRFRFDRNKNVDDDMTFWIRLLGWGKPVIGIGGPSVSNLILSLDYIGFEVPELDVLDEHPDQDSA